MIKVLQKSTYRSTVYQDLHNNRTVVHLSLMLIEGRLHMLVKNDEVLQN